ncbi:hypothetical protein SAMD00019534_039580, partial [Acytostelium subglobosum LB1]|uniref:hypothetical protein n=1 Tax=Acytostelium subglobosum LB1 TaxID=1410327 RepID=UPI00064496F1
STGEKYLLNILSQANIKSLPENVLHQLLYKVKMQEITNQTPQNAEILKYIQPLYPPNPSRVLSPYLHNDIASPNSKRSQDALVSKLMATSNGAFPLPFQLLQSFMGVASSPAILKELLQPYPKLVESDIAQIVGMMAETVSQPSLSAEATVPLMTFSGSLSTSPIAVPSQDDSDSAHKSQATWNFSVFVDVIKELYPAIDWSLVIKELDYSQFVLHDQRGLNLILSIFKKASASDAKFPVHYLLDHVWSNSLGQLSFLKVALQSDFPFQLSSKRRLEQSALGKVSQTVAHWNSLSLIDTLLELSDIDEEHYSRARSLFDYPLKHCPDFLLMGLSSLADKMDNRLFRELIVLLFQTLLFNHNYQVLIFQLWKEHPDIVVNGMSDIYLKDPSYLSRFLDVSQELKILTQMLTFKQYPFVIELAVLASQREFLFLERWLQERMKDDIQFVRQCVLYLAERINGDSTHISISPTILMSLYKTLLERIDTFPTDIANDIRAISPRFSEMDLAASHPNPMPNMAATAAAPESTDRRFPEDIEEETNLYLLKLYKEQISVDQIIITLKDYKNSGQNTRENEIYKCLLFNLFDEYKFLPDYPDKELKITAYLFGSMIKNQLITSEPLRIALKYVLDALKHPQDTNMFNFGVTALISFASRLVEWPAYWSQICAIENFQTFSNGDLIKQINAVIDSSEMPVHGASSDFQRIPSGSNISFSDALNAQHANDRRQEAEAKASLTQQQQAAAVPAPTSPTRSDNAGDVTDNKKSTATATTPKKQSEQHPTEEYSSMPIGTLVQASEDIVQPEEAVKDKMFFIINNISMYNMDAKVKEMKDVLKAEFYEFLAQYFVVKRVSIEPNFHNLYVTFIDRMNIPELTQKVLQFTQQNVTTLLKSDKIKSKTDLSERTLLKNLGGFLGLITLAKNKPLLQKTLSPKDLLLAAVDNGMPASSCTVRVQAARLWMRHFHGVPPTQPLVDGHHSSVG